MSQGPAGESRLVSRLMILRNALCGLLLLALFASLPVQGWASGTMARVTGAVVLCTEAGLETVLTDRLGVPVGPHPDCPDCMPGFGLGRLAEPETIAAPVGKALRIALPVHGTRPFTRSGSPHWPRAPPV